MGMALTEKVLVFQQGKKICGEFYVASIYDDNLSKMLECHLFELSTGTAFTTSIQYGDFDDLFRFDSSLVNPVNSHARFQWLVERLDLVLLDEQDERRIVLAPEPTRDTTDELPYVRASTESFYSTETVREQSLMFLKELRGTYELKVAQRFASLERIYQLSHSSLSGTRVSASQPAPHALKSSAALVPLASHGTLHAKPAMGTSLTGTRSKFSVPRISRLNKDPAISEQANVSKVTHTSFEVGVWRASSELYDRLKLLSLEIVNSRALYINAELAKFARIQTLKLQRWGELQNESILRVSSSRDRASHRAILDSRRERVIEEKRLLFHRKFYESLRLAESDRSRAEKAREHRIATAKQRLFVIWTESILSKLKVRRNRERIDLIRDRNIELKLEIRDRRLKEKKWRSEAMGNVPAEVKGSNSADSVKSGRTGNSSVAVRVDPQKVENEILEKAEFLASMEKHDRVNAKLDQKRGVAQLKTAAQIEVEKVALWKQQQFALREKLMLAKLNKNQTRSDETHAATIQAAERARLTHMLNMKRQAAWIERGKLRNDAVVKSALSNVACADALAPFVCLSVV